MFHPLPCLQNRISGNAVDELTSVDKLMSRHCVASAPRVFSASAAKRTASLPISRCAGRLIAGRQTKHNLSHLGGIADLFAPIRFQGLGNSTTDGS